eukprot:g800.t1
MLAAVHAGAPGLFPRAPARPGSGGSDAAAAAGSGANATNATSSSGGDPPATQGAKEGLMMMTVIFGMLAAGIAGTWFEIHSEHPWRGWAALLRHARELRAQGSRSVELRRALYALALRFTRWWSGAVVFSDFALFWALTFPARDFDDETLASITPTYGPGFRCSPGPVAGWEAWGYVRCFKAKDPTVVDVFEGLGIAQAIGTLLQHAVGVSSSFFVTNRHQVLGVTLYRAGALVAFVFTVKDAAMGNEVSAILWLTTLVHLLGAAFAMLHGGFDRGDGGGREGRGAHRAAGKGKSSPGSRYDSSLGLLTKKFVNLIQSAPEGLLDLNKAAQQLGVQKRRIYDITNVLEGIGLIEKKGKNNIQWKGSSPEADDGLQEKVNGLRQRINTLREEEQQVDSFVQQMTELVQQCMKEQEELGDKGLAYVTHADITNIPQFANETVVAVKAPAGTTLEVPDPDMEDPTNPLGQRKYQIFLRTDDDAGITTYLVNDPPGGEGMEERVEPTEMEDDEQDAGDGGRAPGSTPVQPLYPSAGGAFPIKMEVEPLSMRGSFGQLSAEDEPALSELFYSDAAGDIIESLKTPLK